MAYIFEFGNWQEGRTALHHQHIYKAFLFCPNTSYQLYYFGKYLPLTVSGLRIAKRLPLIKFDRFMIITKMDQINRSLMHRTENPSFLLL